MAGLRPSTRVLAAFGAALLAPMPSTAGAQATCFEEGKAWDWKPYTDSIPNAGYFHAPSYCQSACQSRGPYCLHFVWKAQGNFSLGIGNGGCWVVGDNATQTAVDTSVVGRVVSGPQECPPENATTPLPTASPVTTLTPAATLAPATTLTPVTLAPVPETGNGTNGTNGTAMLPDLEEEAGGFPWWGILLIILGLLGLGAAVMYGSCGEGSKKKKSSKKKKTTSSRKKTEDIEAVPLQENAVPEVTAPLITPDMAQTAVAEPIAAAPPVAPYMTNAPAIMAAPTTSGYAPMPQIQYVQPGVAMPIASVRQPQFVTMG